MAELPDYELPTEREKAAWQKMLSEYLIVEPLEDGFARRLSAERIRTFAELGSSIGPISQRMAPVGVDCFAVDLTPPEGSFSPMIRADLRALPLRANYFDAVAAVNCLYFLADPASGVREARAALKPGGLFLAGAPSRFHDPELRDVVPNWGEESPFDAEEAAAIVGEVFDDLEVEWWEVPAWELLDTPAVIDYLVAFKVPEPEERAAQVSVPTTITKSGVNIWARA